MFYRISLFTLLTFFLSLLSGLAWAQVQVFGTIRNEKGDALNAVMAMEVGVNNEAYSDARGQYKLTVKHQPALIRFSYAGYETKELKITKTEKLDVILNLSKQQPVSSKLIVENNSIELNNTTTGEPGSEHPFKNPLNWPSAGFSVNVDGSSYSNIYRYSLNAELPFQKLVRIEEMINYFRYDYPTPKPEDKHPFTVTTELSVCPWNKQNRLLLIGLQGKEIPVDQLPAANLVFLIDASTSMNDPLKLPLVKASMKMLARQLRSQDMVSIVVYSGNSHLILPATAGNNHSAIEKAIDELQPGGKTAGAAGIKMAYRTARQNFIQQGNNRIILCTDGDFNVGISDDAAVDSLIASERKSGVMLSVLGFGNDNRHAAKMRRWAQIGNGNHNFINGFNDANRLFVNEFASTLYTIAQQVKPVIFFDPEKVQLYRLIGYDIKTPGKNTQANSFFEAGDMGSGHSLTVLFEIVPVGIKSLYSDTTSLATKYAKKPAELVAGDLAYLHIPYLLPSSGVMQEVAVHVKDDMKNLELSSDNFRFAAAVAASGLLLRDSEYKQKANYKDVISMAKTAVGKDKGGFRADFITMAENFKRIDDNTNKRLIRK